jgi:ectoine hydroxylase-related dioxygenase (phytanoyl-CoA dioxygenase family)
MTADDLRCLDEAGYLVLPACLGSSRELLSHLETRFEQAGENAGHAFRAEPFARNVDIALPQTDPDVPRLFAPLTADLTALECVEHLLGGEYELAALRAYSSNPFALAPDPPRPGPGARTCRVLWLLDDFTEAGTAALRVVPGSHRLDRSPAMLPENLPAVSVMASAGSVIILHGRLWTGVAANAGNRHLRALRCEYVRRAAGNSG